jgi:hypothetical protein
LKYDQNLLLFLKYFTFNYKNHFRYFGPADSDKKKMMIVFGSNEAVEVLRRSPYISVDGTFDTAPPPFVQLFILMATLPNGSTCPTVYGLLPDKTAATYTQFFNIVKGLADDMFTGRLFLFNYNRIFQIMKNIYGQKIKNVRGNRFLPYFCLNFKN